VRHASTVAIDPGRSKPFDRGDCRGASMRVKALRRYRLTGGLLSEPGGETMICSAGLRRRNDDGPGTVFLREVQLNGATA